MTGQEAGVVQEGRRGKRTLFVTGTDTDVGKTVVSCGLLFRARQQGMSTAAIKPISSGVVSTDAGPRNRDALLLQRYVSMPLSYEQINPVILTPAIAPHIALQQAGRRISVAQLVGFCRGVMACGADLTVIEGAGGWRLPLSARELYSSVPKELNVPVVVVVAMKLGCINHALLTAEAIAASGLTMLGWVANQADTMACYKENLATLKAMLPAPCLGEVPHLPDPAGSKVACYLDFP